MFPSLLFPRLPNSLSLSTDPVADNTLGRHSLSGSSSLGIIIISLELTPARPTRHRSNEEPETQGKQTIDLNLNIPSLWMMMKCFTLELFIDIAFVS